MHPAKYYKDRAEERKKKKALKKTKMFGQPDIEEEIDPGDEVVYQPETQDSIFPTPSSANQIRTMKKMPNLSMLNLGPTSTKEVIPRRPTR